MSKESQGRQPKEQVIQLYQGSKRIHPKLAKGRFTNLRVWAVIATQFVFYVLPWFNWSGRQAVLFDIPERHFYIFGLSLGMGDLIYLAGLLMICAFGLFWWTTIAGRLWCGYACPQTVYTEIMLWIDHLVEGDRNKRLKLDKEPWNFRKIRIKAVKYLLIFAVSAWTGITFAGWFTPIRELVPAIFTMTVGGGILFTAAFYGFMTWFMGHMMREQVCKYMCPYARFQSAMFDRDTLIISYDVERGEPRGARKKNANKEETQLGDCINCTMCVQVCPVGIDIRDGLQYECIGCAACIDACDEIMDKMNYPRGLIRYTTEAALEHEYPEKAIKRRLLRPRVLGYGSVLMLVVIAWLIGIATRATLEVDIIKDRGVMVRENNKGWLENAYNLRIVNASEDEQVLTAKVSGFDEIALTGLPEEGVRVPGGETITIPVQVSTIPEYADKGSHPIEFEFTYRSTVDADAKPDVITEKASFIGE
ncbi:cytochrome c oxidase accessory protein CcoG [Neisseria weaveri]|uniref:Putative ferredoxin n=1 Tax=Neisseria weaveri TaxID=28091 RepID=A0A3S5AC14_9NEIS|nr:cytochrome c oxidase accessory protein CcoG [Neisseria weaveri]EGV35992.1 cytochrome c oxidase accessory protein CcoG [Neisseria weaveri LMG 5135]EGV37349.1 cytochrome c oxidase accessory protein CcoG [Neisseria weaveri ATCC 51223]SAY50593.1 putative ferredoxin [Neisseria weaveri]VEJ52004.1 putative ferredoxin [Neisseria weaveri]